MKVLILLVVNLLIACSAWSQEVGQRVYLNLEKGEYATIFRKPGINWKYCLQNKDGVCVDAMGWPDKDTKVWIAGKKIVAATPDPFTEEMGTEEYYPVQFEYTRKSKDGVVEKVRGPIGYIDAAYIDTEKRDPIYDIKSSSATKSSRTCTLQPANLNKQIEDAKCALELKNLEDATSLVKDRVGFCADLKSDKASANLYDSVILPKMKSMNAPKIRAENGEYITNDQLIDIDALSRTLYGEMASCFKHGLEYPMAVARIILNRSENKGQRKNFIRGPHVDEKPDISKVATSPTQFSLWLRKLNGKKNPPLGMAMCPPRDKNQKLWHGDKPSSMEQAVWNQAVKIATEAVMFPNSFKKRTAKLAERYFYTSGVGQFYNMKKDKVDIEGRSLNKSKCIEIWHDPKMDESNSTVQVVKADKSANPIQKTSIESVKAKKSVTEKKANSGTRTPSKVNDSNVPKKKKAQTKAKNKN